MPEAWVNVFDAQRAAERKLGPGPCGCFSGAATDELTPALCGFATPAELGPRHLGRALPTRVYSEAAAPGSTNS